MKTLTVNNLYLKMNFFRTWAIRKGGFMNERVYELRKTLGLTMEKFGGRLV